MSDTSTTTLLFADGETVRLSGCSRGTSIFQHARSAGIDLAHDCLNGSCGTCKASLHGGEVAYAIDRSLLALVEGDDTQVLVCQATPASDQLDIALPYTRASLLPERKRKLVITAIEKVSQSVWSVTAKAQGLRMFTFLAGQYLRVAPVGQDFERAYSPATAPGAAEQQFLIRELPEGRMSRYLAQAQVGDIWQVAGPFGVFYRRHSAAPALFVAGGTGLAPMLSMLRQMQAQGGDGPVGTLVFGVTQRADLFMLETLQDVEQTLKGLRIKVCVTAGDAVPGLYQGSVLDAIDASDIAALGADGCAYLCGPPGMVDAVREKLVACGLGAPRVFAEQFLPA